MTEKRILVLGRPNSGKFTLLKELTGSVPNARGEGIADQNVITLTEPLTESCNNTNEEKLSDGEISDQRASHAGLSHSITLSTKYYTHTVPIWLDEYSAGENIDEQGIETWAAEFASEEAKDVVAAIGAIVFTFRKPDTADDVVKVRQLVASEVKHIQAALATQYQRRLKGDDSLEEEDYDDYADLLDWDGICLAVAMPPSSLPKSKAIDLVPEDWEVTLQPYGFEYIDFEKTGRNDYGELTGPPRIIEALETFSWSNQPTSSIDRNGYLAYDSDIDDDDDQHNGRQDEFDEPTRQKKFDSELREMQLEMAAIHFALDENENENESENEDQEEADDVRNDRPLAENDIDELEKIMQRMKQIREMGKGLPLEERQKLADQVANDLMRLI
ncbi:uncharacterized protein V1516DRAFT_688616 [Lipomyces oligophaga]|uniref:uncharacterized protein n=1 Tax=Lipomyces oligophaga TaxID=45792 RepID=UPI0034CF88BC